MRDPRTSIRGEFQATVRYRGPGAAEEIQIPVRVADISEKGALLITPKEVIPLEAEVRATFHLPGHENEMPVGIVGKARRTKILKDGQCGTGIEFTEVSETGLRAIRSFIALQELGETF